MPKKKPEPGWICPSPGGEQRVFEFPLPRCRLTIFRSRAILGNWAGLFSWSESHIDLTSSEAPHAQQEMLLAVRKLFVDAVDVIDAERTRIERAGDLGEPKKQARKK